jgi:hypothetical protein
MGEGLGLERGWVMGRGKERAKRRVMDWGWGLVTVMDWMMVMVMGWGLGLERGLGLGWVMDWG